MLNSMGWKKALAMLLMAAAPLVLTLMLFAPLVGPQLVWDDKFLLAHPLYKRMGFSLEAIFSPVLNNASAYWRPWGMLFVAPHFDLLSTVKGARVASLLWHGALCFGAALLLWRALGKAASNAAFAASMARASILSSVSVPRSTALSLEARAALSTLLGCWLAVLPGASQAAYWISHRVHLVGGVTLLAALIAADALFSRGRPRAGAALFAAGAFLACLASESMAAWSVAALGVGWAWGWRAGARAWAGGLGVALLLWGALRSFFLGAIAPLGGLSSLSALGALSDLSDATWAQTAPFFQGFPGANYALSGDRSALGAAGLIMFAGIGLLAWRRARAGAASGPMLVGWALATLVAAAFGRLTGADGISGVLGGEYAVGAAFLWAGLAVAGVEFFASAPAARSKPALVGAAIALCTAFAFSAVQSRTQARVWSDDKTLWDAALAGAPSSPLAVSNSMVALSKAGDSSRAIALGEGLWQGLVDHKQLTRPEAAAIANYVSLLQRAGELDRAAAVAVVALPKSPGEPLLAVNAASVFLERKDWSDAINAANFSLARRGKDWHGRRLAAALYEALARAELGAGRASVAEGHLIESRRLLGMEVPFPAAPPAAAKDVKEGLKAKASEPHATDEKKPLTGPRISAPEFQPSSAR